MTLRIPPSGEHQSHVDILGPLYNHQEDDIEYVEDVRPRLAVSEAFDAARAMQREMRGVVLTTEQAVALRTGMQEDIAALDEAAKESGCFGQTAIIRGEGIVTPEFIVNPLTGYFQSSSSEKNEQERLLYDTYLDSKYIVGVFQGFSLHFKKLQDTTETEFNQEGAVLDEDKSEEDSAHYMPVLVYRLEVAQAKDVSAFVDSILYAIGEVDLVSIEFDKDKRLDEMPPGLEDLFSVKNRRFQEGVARLYELLISKDASPLEIAKRASAVMNAYKDPHDARIQDKVIDLIHYCKRDAVYKFYFRQYSQIEPDGAEHPITYFIAIGEDDYDFSHSLDNLIFRSKFTFLDEVVDENVKKVELNIALFDTGAEEGGRVMYFPLDKMRNYEIVDD